MMSTESPPLYFAKGGTTLYPALRLNNVIPAQAGIQMIKKPPAKRDNIVVLLLHGWFVLAGFPPVRE